MSQIIQRLDQQQLKSLCGVVAHSSEGLTKSELTTLLGQCGICAVDDGSSRNQLGYTIGLNKRDWLYNCLVTEINKSQSFSKVFSFLQAVLNPAAYTSADSRQKYRHLLEETNKILLFAGLSIDQSGRLVVVSQAETLTEVDLRVNHLKKALYDRAIHSEVQKYCIEDYLRADYYDAVFEAAKGLAERVRQISGLTTDGGTLFQTALSKNDPYIFFNAMKTDSERSEFTGLKELLEAIFHLVRNPAAHTPKVNWKTDETKALDILTLILFADLFEFVLNYEVPRCKQYNRSGKNESEHGTDVIAYRFFTDEKKPHKNDELVAIEVKALLSSKEAGKVIKDAVDDSKKDEHRVSHTLDYYRKKLRSMGKLSEASSIARFQQKTEYPYQTAYVGAAISSMPSIEKKVVVGIKGADLELKTDQSVFYVHGADLMSLAHQVFERCIK